MPFIYLYILIYSVDLLQRKSSIEGGKTFAEPRDVQLTTGSNQDEALYESRAPCRRHLYLLLQPLLCPLQNFP
jgi:hypothetical protein